MIPDAEIIAIINEVFDNLGWAGTYTIKLNSRKILDGLFEVCGVPPEKIRPISSAVDKLDKSPWYVSKAPFLRSLADLPMQDRGSARDD